MKTIAIIDYGMGNLFSVEKKLKKIGADAIITDNITSIRQADKLILPGVGHFGKAISNLKSSGLFAVINEVVLVKKTPILGICLGMQLMTRYSEEGNVEGFGWFDANVVCFRVQDTLKHKVPHTGWNSINTKKTSKLTEGIPERPEFYFVHSYHAVSNNPDEVLATTNYEYDFVSALEKDHIFGLQFHPEKSHDAGETILKNFLSL